MTRKYRAKSGLHGYRPNGGKRLIKLLHFADTHIGMENYGRTNPRTGLSSRVTDFLHSMDQMIEHARQNDVDMAIFAGDAFKTRNPNPTYQREFAWRILDLASLCPVVLLVGNHDLPINIKRASSVEIYETLRVPNVLVARTNELHIVETKAGPVQVATVPYPVRARLLEEEEGVPATRNAITNLDAALQEHVELVIRELTVRAAESDMPRVLTGHFSVIGAMRGSEKQVMLGRDIAVTLGNLADPVWDFVALGHIHKHQNLTETMQGAPPVVYSGSLERIDFGEEGDEKGFVWVELERGATRWQFVPLKTRPFVTLRVDIRRANNPTQVVLDDIRRYDLRDAVVRVIITTDVEANSLINVNRIETGLRESGAYIVAAIHRDIQEPNRMRLGPTPEGLSPQELLKHYLASKEIAHDRIETLVEAAQTVFDESQISD